MPCVCVLAKRRDKPFNETGGADGGGEHEIEGDWLCEVVARDG